MKPKRRGQKQYQLNREMQRIADACHDLSAYARDNGAIEVALKCLKEARAVASIGVSVEQGRMTMGAAQNALLQIESQRRIQDARDRRRQAITVTPIPAPSQNGTAEEDLAHA